MVIDPPQLVWTEGFEIPPGNIICLPFNTIAKAGWQEYRLSPQPITVTGEEYIPVSLIVQRNWKLML